MDNIILIHLILGTPSVSRYNIMLTDLIHNLGRPRVPEITYTEFNL